MRSTAAAVLVPLALLAGCSTPAPAPPPVVRAPPPRSLPAPMPASSDWRYWPLTPGDWSYTPDGAGSVARFGGRGVAPALTLRCDRGRRQVVLTKRLEPSAAPALTVRTSSTQRTLPLQATGDGASAVLAATDPLLDAMGFSRGRFVIEQAGGATLVIPAWAEILRVTEDCRG